MSDLHIVVLAAGKGTRMRSARPKVLHEVAGLPMLAHVLRAARALSPASITVVVGHQGTLVRDAFRDEAALQWVTQEPQRGTAHALLATEPVLSGRTGTVVLLSGDVPALTSDTLHALVDAHIAAAAAVTVVTARVDDPSGYGRIVREGGHLARIVEHKDASPAERSITEVNAGIYACALDSLFETLRQIATDNAQGEYYLPDLIALHRRGGRTVATCTVDDPATIGGVNSRVELASMTRLLRERINARLMGDGVTMLDPDSTYIDVDVSIGADTVLYPQVTIERGSVVGAGCTIHSGVRLTRAAVQDGATVLDHSVVCDSVVGNGATVGPSAHLRAHSVLHAGAKVGNFVELKKTVLGAGSKAMHLAYLGDTVAGDDVNIGAGTITCNYDGERKQVTTIQDGAFIGSDTQLIAPVTVGAGAYVGTGTTVRQDVPSGALAVSAGPLRVIEGWVERKRGRRGAPQR